MQKHTTIVQLGKLVCFLAVLLLFIIIRFKIVKFVCAKEKMLVKVSLEVLLMRLEKLN